MSLRLYKEYMRAMQDELIEFGRHKIKAVTPSGSFSLDKQKCKPKDLHEFTIKGEKIMASSRNDAIKKYKHLKNK